MRLLFFPFLAGAFALLGLAILAFDIWMLVDAVRRPESEFSPPAARVWWIVGLAVGIVLGWLGLVVSIVYFFTVRKPLTEGRPPQQLFGGGSGVSSQPRAGRFCRNCGEPLGTHARFCQNCGSPADLEDR